MKSKREGELGIFRTNKTTLNGDKIRVPPMMAGPEIGFLRK